MEKVVSSKKMLSWKNMVFVTSMLFGLFFGAGNLIFPIYMGQVAGANVIMATVGFVISGVGIPILAVVALGKSKSEGVYDLGCKVNKIYSLIFTCLLYLAIGPFLAIPRCATVSFTVGIEPIIGKDNNVALIIFSLIFFIVALYFSLKSSKILTWVGKILNPIFLVFLFVLIGKALIFPMDNYQNIAATGKYIDSAFATGFLEGYNTLDALAGLAFGIVVVTVIRNLDIKDSDDVANNTVVAGVGSGILMCIIYVALAIVGSTTRNVLGECSNGGEVFSKVANYYFGPVGATILAITVTVACLKTSIGLITSCAETFVKLFPHTLSQNMWAVVFAVGSFIVANFGLNTIISFSAPVLMFLYPLAIVLILLAIFDKYFGGSKLVYNITIYFTLIPAILELIVSLPFKGSIMNGIVDFRGKIPLGAIGFSFIPFAICGFVVSLIISKTHKVGK